MAHRGGSLLGAHHRVRPTCPDYHWPRIYYTSNSKKLEINRRLFLEKTALTHMVGRGVDVVTP